MVIWVYGLKYFGVITMVNCNLQSPMAVISAICGSIVVVKISELIAIVKIINRILSFLGRNSLAILCFHIFELHTGILGMMTAAFLPHRNYIIILFLTRLCWGFFWAYASQKTIFLEYIFSGQKIWKTHTQNFIKGGENDG